MGCHPAKGPGRSAGLRSCLLEGSFYFLGKSGQRTAFDRLHDYQGNSQLLSQRIALIACLNVTVYVVVLDLAEIPRTACQNLLKDFIIIVEGKADITDLSGLTHGLHERKHIQLFYLFPGFLVQGMQKIKIHMIHSQALQLLVKNSLYILFFLQLPDRKFCGQIEGIPVIFFQYLTHKRLAVSIVIRVSRIDIGNAGLDGCIQHFLCFRLIDLSIRRLWKTHASKT